MSGPESAAGVPSPSVATPVAAPGVTPNPWDALRRHTAARIALGRAGVSLPTQAQLAFQLSHAQARDAVHLGLEVDALRTALQALHPEVLSLHSAAADRHTYLQRPDLGRRLDAASRQALLARGAPAGDARPDLAVVVADGLSALAVVRQALPLLQRLLPAVASRGWRLAPLCVVQQGRVAVGDEVGECLGAGLALVLIGERPGLSSPDSLGLYLTFAPRVGTTDDRRNCISNVRPAGLDFDTACARALWLLEAARQRGCTGVALKDESAPPPVAGTGASFLLTD